MTFMDHLEELRWLLVRSTIVVLIMAMIIFFVSDYLFDEIVLAPLKPEFVTYGFFCDLAQQLNVSDICVTAKDFNFIIQNTDMEGQVNILVWMCIVGGFIAGFPYILWEFWKFISPALYEKERKGAKVFITVSSLLFFIGVLFGYYLITPMSVNFFATFTVSDLVKNQFNLDSYMSMLKTSLIACGLFFELPVIIYFLARLGLVTAELLRKTRRWSIVGILVVAAIVTPPDVVSQVIVSIPMIIIFEGSIVIAALVGKKKKAEELANT
ncbi:twin-arginine translocase subunit TatC [Flavobacterium sp.]|uniref:twin-arginine translocase subunit TatC n=1 Tax=Flavobacterium sp. TaxID=239 RepID=UPI001219293D|nr:twin-arginine translocase subunit TatC [Flavobacterium sp.]RZJ70959.1 MAG: twin-arginine translocase subunit TatC [Flavobacterium sp.]